MQVIIDLHQFLMTFALGVYASEVVSSPFSTLLEGGGQRGGERGGEGGGETK